MTDHRHILVRQERPKGWRGWVYLRMVELSLALVKMFMFLKVSGAEKIPRKGPLILISNHPSYFDPPTLVGLMIYHAQRDLSFMAWDKLFKVPVVRFFTTAYRAYPVNRENPGRAPYQTLLSILENGGAAGVFPEGSRSHGRPMGEWKPGALRAAFATKATILPVTMATAGEFWPRDEWRPRFLRRHHIIFHDALTYEQYMAGKPADMHDKVWQEQLVTRIRDTINAPITTQLAAVEHNRRRLIEETDPLRQEDKTPAAARRRRFAEARARLGIEVRP